MYFAKVAVQALLLGAAVAVPAVPARRSVLKERHPVPRGWTAVSRPSSSHTINLEIGLKHQNQDKLEQHVKEVSNPAHARYGNYLSAAEVKKLITPSEESFDLVNSWLSDHGISTARLSPAEDSIWVRLPVSKVEELLDTTYSVFRHEDGTEFVRAPEWSLPAYLHDHIDVIQPTNSFFRAKRNTQDAVSSEAITWDTPPSWWNENQPAPGQECDISVVCNVTGTNLAGDKVAATTLTCLRCLYGTYDYVAQAANKNSIGIANYLNNTQVRSDLQQFLELYRPEAAGYAEQFRIISINGGLDDQNPTAADYVNQMSLEGDLDGEMVLGISWPTPLTSWVTGGEPPFIPDLNEPTIDNEPYLNWQQYVLAQSTIPNVITTSYGDDEQTVPMSYAVRVCDNFKQMAARGVSVIFSSGDSGVGANGTCYSNTDPSVMEFIPAFPASCPWVTTVGATKNYLPEVAVSRFGSGAGFSNYFTQPSWQTSAVEGYLAKIGNLYQGLYNASGRAYPDVAAQGNHDVIVYGGNVTTIGGTSASAPTFAGVIALVNDALIAAGKPQLGYLNPWIYGGAYTAFTDILAGSSIGCNGSGFPATVGWDAVTGFGTPNFGELVNAAFQEAGSGWQNWS